MPEASFAVSNRNKELDESPQKLSTRTKSSNMETQRHRENNYDRGSWREPS
jgi:hypothetical protein